MRLGILEHGHRLPARSFMRLSRMAFRQEVDDVMKTALYRPEFFGRALFNLAAPVLRGPSYWTTWEREYMAVQVSRANECPFCVAVHEETARLEAPDDDLEKDREIRPELEAVVRFLVKSTREPAMLSPADADAVRAAGVADDAIVEALHVALLFNIVNRLANAFGWSWDSDAHLASGAMALHRFRYKAPPFVLR